MEWFLELVGRILRATPRRTSGDPIARLSLPAAGADTCILLSGVGIAIGLMSSMSIESEEIAPSLAAAQRDHRVVDHRPLTTRS
jgi:hypothetical protein